MYERDLEYGFTAEDYEESIDSFFDALYRIDQEKNYDGDDD